ncbi:MAG: hypothetical protein L0154_21980 [Chloroflexi bacterium]|nr:hypothetical protein [Chloroflexota bacterium]
MRSFDKKPVQDENVQSKAPNQQVTGTPNRHQQILQMQRQYGNQAVRRMLQREVTIDEMDTSVSTAEPGASSTTSIGDGTASVTAENGVVDITAASVNINAPMTRHAGIDESEVVVADSVIASSYSPGAGNVW